MKFEYRSKSTFAFDYEMEGFSQRTNTRGNLFPNMHSEDIHENGQRSGWFMNRSTSVSICSWYLNIYGISLVTPRNMHYEDEYVRHNVTYPMPCWLFAFWSTFSASLLFWINQLMQHSWTSEPKNQKALPEYRWVFVYFFFSMQF